LRSLLPFEVVDSKYHRLRGLRYTTLQCFKHVESSPPVRRSRSGDIDFAFGISIDLVLVVAHQNELMLAQESIVLCECVTHRPCCSYDAALCLPKISKCLSRRGLSSVRVRETFFWIDLPRNPRGGAAAARIRWFDSSESSTPVLQSFPVGKIPIGISISQWSLLSSFSDRPFL